MHTKDRPFIDWLLKNHVDINENVGTAEDQITPLMVAVIAKDEALAHQFLMGGANVFTFYKQFSLREYAEYLLGLKSAVTSLIIQRTGGMAIAEPLPVDDSSAHITN